MFISAYIPCPKENFQCQNGECVPGIERCNGQSACSDHSDEHLCGHNSTGQS